jgi:type II secretory pathway pseudopilin PulG
VWVRASIRRSDERGYTLVELLAVLVTIGAVLAALTTVFVSGTKAELDSNSRFQAQTQANLALARLRGDVHCASALSPSGAASTIVLTLASSCSGGGGTVSWCALGGGSRYGLYRAASSTCDTSALQVADYLTSAAVFTYTAPVTSTSLGSLAVDLRVNARPATNHTLYELTDSIVLRNTSR